MTRKRKPLDLPYPFPEGRGHEIEKTDHYQASDGQKYYIHHDYIDPNVGGIPKLAYFHFAREIEERISNKRSKMTKEELAQDNLARDVMKNRVRNASKFNPLDPAYENVYSRTDDEGNVVIPNEEPKRIHHFNAGCNCFT